MPLIEDNLHEIALHVVALCVRLMLILADEHLHAIK